VLELLAKDPSDRPASAERARDRLQEIADLSGTGQQIASDSTFAGPADRLVEYLTLYVVKWFPPRP
jgi:hypothetical protein